MGYKNGRDILPPDLLAELQKYVQGELIYIPRSSENRAAWGELNGTRFIMDERNHEIYLMYKKGVSIEKLMECYHLSCDSIKKILYKICRNNV
ncbi:MAG: CD3324 family protein [Clostridiales bacterium]|nr:CD3324 family protein [Clostridiales bacterium]HBM80889.1 hypothetical protein [Clostridiaceae bacterium]